MASDKCIYVIDSSSWLRIDEHPNGNRILDALTTLLEDGRLKCPPEVINELKTVDSATAWVEANKSEIVENWSGNFEFLQKVGEVTHKFPAMSGARCKKDKADPYVVAMAVTGSKNPGQWVVVCDETVAKRRNRKLPTACAAFGVESLGIFEMLEREFPDEEWQYAST